MKPYPINRRQLAIKMGIPVTTIANWFNGSEMSARYLLLLADTLEITPHEAMLMIYPDYKSKREQLEATLAVINY